MGKNILIISVFLLFTMLWLPLGQHDFLVDHWMKIGTYSIPFLLIGVFSFLDTKDFKTLFTNPRFVSLIMLFIYILHQFEEHWIDLYGNYYSFYDFNNNFILGLLGKGSSEIKPLTKESIFVINTSLVWLIGIIAIIRSPNHLYPLFAFAGIVVVNGIVHILAAIVQFQYNPGLFTSILLFIPAYILFVKHIKMVSIDSKELLFFGLLWALLAHVIMVAGLLAANWFNLFPEYIYFIFLIIWSLTPLFLYKNKYSS